MTCTISESVIFFRVKTPHIYAICVDGVERYIGKTSVSLSKRLRDHISLANRGGKSHFSNLIRQALREGFEISIIWVDEVQVPEEWGAVEAAYIQAYREEGFNLANQAPGGEGGPVSLGRKQTPKHIANLSAARRGKKRTPEQCENIARGKMGKKLGPQSPEHLSKRAAAVSAAKKGRPWTEKQRQARMERVSRRSATREEPR